MLSNLELQLIPQVRVQELLGISAMTLWRWQREPSFPTPISHNGRKFFRATEIYNWQESYRGHDGREITNADVGRVIGRKANSTFSESSDVGGVK